VLGVGAEARRQAVGVRERDQRLAAEVESQPRLAVRPRQLDLAVLEPVHAVAVGPRGARGQRRAVEGPCLEVDPLPVQPAAQLVDADLEPVEALGDGEGGGQPFSAPATNAPTM
jgi:hypothetical protein